MLAKSPDIMTEQEEQDLARELSIAPEGLQKVGWLIITFIILLFFIPFFIYKATAYLIRKLLQRLNVLSYIFIIAIAYIVSLILVLLFFNALYL
jgi:uncharacterized membrane protein YidH (DUF202 family)